MQQPCYSLVWCQYKRPMALWGGTNRVRFDCLVWFWIESLFYRFFNSEKNTSRTPRQVIQCMQCWLGIQFLRTPPLSTGCGSMVDVVAKEGVLLTFDYGIHSLQPIGVGCFCPLVINPMSCLTSHFETHTHTLINLRISC